MANVTFDQEIRDSLEKLENVLETPVVPGELRYWADMVQGALKPIANLVREHLDEVHADQYRRIRKEDLGLARRIEQLQAEDVLILRDLEQVHQSLQRLQARMPASEPDEKRADDEHFKLVKDGISFVIRARTQETAIATWLAEAFARDRGDVD